MAAGAALVIGAHGALVASASSLDVSSDRLEAWSAGQPADVPGVITCDNFDGADGALAGRAVTSAATCGINVWTTHVGGWSTVAGAATSDGTAGATATIAATADASVSATIVGADTGGHQAGVVLAHEGAGDHLAAVLVGSDPDRVDVVLVDGGVSTVLATAAIVVEPVARLTLVRDGSSVVVTVDGALVVSHVLTAGEVAALGAGSGAGLYASSATIAIDDLTVTTPPAP